MSNLNLRILAPLCGALLLAHAPIALAQNDLVTDETQIAAPPQTPEMAGERFYQFLANGMVRDDRTSGEVFNWARAYAHLSAISRAQIEGFSGQRQSGGPEQLFVLLARQKDEPQFKGKIIGTEGEQTWVEVSPAPDKKRAVVVIAEDGGYRVDVKATYGRWNDLSGEKLDMAWADYTGIVSPALAKNAAYIDNKARSSCQSNLKQAMLGILQYAQDYQQNYPPARKWIDEIMPYVKSETIFRCPSLANGQNYGYALNQNLDGINLGRFDSVAQTVAIYETNDLTRNAFGVADERVYRHLGGSNIAFADGHVKWFREGDEPQQSVSFKP